MLCIFEFLLLPELGWRGCFDIYGVLPSFFFENWYKVLRLWSFFCDWNFLTSRKENCPAFLGAAASGGPSINYENLAVTFSIYAESSQILIVGFVLVYFLNLLFRQQFQYQHICSETQKSEVLFVYIARVQYSICPLA